MGNVVFCGENLARRSGVTITDANWQAASPIENAVLIQRPDEAAQASLSGGTPNVVIDLGHPYKWDTVFAGYFSDISAWRNLMKQSNDSSNAAYTKTNMSSGTQITTTTMSDPPSGMEVWQHLETTDNAAHHVQQTWSKVASIAGQYVLSMEMEGAVPADRHIRLEANSGAAVARADFDLSDGSAVTTATAGGWTLDSSSSAASGNYYVYTIVFTCSTEATIVGRAQMLHASSGVTYAGDATKGFNWTGLQLERAGARSPFVNTAAAPGMLWRLRGAMTQANLTVASPNRDSGLLSVSHAAGDLSGADWVSTYYRAASPAALQWLRGDFFDDDNSTDWKLGVFGVYNSWSPAQNIEAGWTQVIGEDSIQNEQPGTNPISSIEQRYRVIDLDLDWITEAEAEESQVIDEYCGTSRPVLVIYDPDDDSAHRQRQVIYGTIERNLWGHRTYSTSAATDVYRKRYRIREWINA